MPAYYGSTPKLTTAAKRKKKGTVSTPGTGGGGYEVTPDQMDRDRTRRRAAGARARARGEQGAIQKVKPRPIKPGYGRWDDYPRNA